MPVEKKVGNRTMYRYQNQLFGASGGIIRVFDERDGTEATVTLADFQARADALGFEASRCIYPEERIGLEDAANCMNAACEDAASQGDPTNVEVQAWRMRHRAPKFVQVGAPVPNMPALPAPPAELLRGGKLLV